jgi:signal transduction histidine kinase
VENIAMNYEIPANQGRGDVTVDSGLGKGSCFTFSLPLYRAIELIAVQNSSNPTIQI